MKILIVQESDWIKRGPHNTHHLFERLSEKGHEIRVIDYEINWKSNKQHELLPKRMEVKDYHKIRDHAKITVIRPPILHITPFNYVSLLYTHRREIKKQLREFKPDIVVGLGLLNGDIAVRECHKLHIPFVYIILDTIHTLVPEPVFQYIAKSIEQKNYRRSDLIISVNKLLKDYTIKMGADPARSIVLPHGIEVSRFVKGSEDRQKIRSKYGFTDQDTVLFFMGFLYPFSGLIEAATDLKDHLTRYPNIKLFIIGEGPAYNELDKIRKVIPNNLTLLPWQPYPEIPSIISASDICILPSKINDTMKDIVPIKILEYMAARKPVILTKLPGVMAEFGNESGILYIDKPDDVLEKAVEIVKNGSMERLQSQAFTSVEQKDWDLIYLTFEKILADTKQT
ncbi:MAG TPA: glycosyltransferase family 4 protein [Methanocella sp.]|nr:glycosyltransferase family 4 protein [Methanocella sp.]